jgi:hypothetical protein
VNDDAGTDGRDGAGKAGVADDDESPSPALVAGGAVLVAVLVALVAALLVGGEAGAVVAIGALTVLFAAVGVGLFCIARKVGSKADDPAEVERRMAEGLGMSEERTQLRVDRVAGEDDAVPSQNDLDDRYEEADDTREALDERFYEDE